MSRSIQDLSDEELVEQYIEVLVQHAMWEHHSMNDALTLYDLLEEMFERQITTEELNDYK